MKKEQPNILLNRKENLPNAMLRKKKQKSEEKKKR